MGIIALALLILSAYYLRSENPTAAMIAATIAAVLSLMSALIAYSEPIGKLTAGWVAKATILVAAAATFSLSEPAARQIMAYTIWVDPALFPNETRLISAALTGCILWIVGFCLVLTASWSFEKPDGYFSSTRSLWLKRVDQVGRTLGSAIAVLILPPAILLYGNSFVGASLLWTSFYANVVPYDAYYMSGPGTADIPESCKKAYEDTVALDGHHYFCVVRPTLCSNLPDEAYVSFLSDGRVAVLPRRHPLSGQSAERRSELWSARRINFDKCEQSHSIKVTIDDSGQTWSGISWCSATSLEFNCWK